MPSSTLWRATGPFTAALASKAGLVHETRQYLEILGNVHDLAAARRALIDERLPQRSRETRSTIAEFVQRRLVRWNPPAWVLDDLVSFAAGEADASLESALLLHVARQDVMLYAFVQAVIVPRWAAGDTTLQRADAQRFLDEAEPEHPEIDDWSHATRRRVAGGMLSVLRDYGLLRGTTVRQIVEPVVPEAVAEHLVRLLAAEGIPSRELAAHPDWQLWLWDSGRAGAAVRRAQGEGVVS